MGAQQLSSDDIRRYYDQHGPALVAYAYGFVTDVAAAEDVVQQVFLKLLSGVIRTPDVPLAYLYRAVRNAALNVRRSSQRGVQLESQDVLFMHGAGNREAALSLQIALGELPEEQREVVIMKIWSGMTFGEISQAIDAPLNTIASRYRYALERMRERLQPYRSFVKSKE